MDQNHISRIAVLETRVDGFKDDFQEMKQELKELHNCVDNTRNELNGCINRSSEELKSNLEEIRRLSTEQHVDLSAEIKSIKEFKNKWVWTIVGLLAGLTWAVNHLDILSKLF
jgi:archaellum component FlaC